MPFYTSSCFSFVLGNKGENNKETIVAATQRMLTTAQIILIRRNGKFFYVTPDEFKDNDVIIQTQSHAEQSTTQNGFTTNAIDKPSSDNNTDDNIISSGQKSLSSRRSKQSDEINKWREILKNRKNRKERR